MKLRRFLIIIATYIIFGAVLPFLKYKDISAENADAVEKIEYIGNGEAGDRVRIVENNSEALDERLRLIFHAEKYIILSTFDFLSDNSGKDMLCALADAARRGVKVQMLVDGFCEMLKMRSNKYFAALNAHENVNICIYNKLNVLQPWKSMGRMHDKYLIADGKILIMGGRNISDAFLSNYEKKKIDRDILVYNENPRDDSFIKSVERYFEKITNEQYCSDFKPSESGSLKRNAKNAFVELIGRCENIRKEKSVLSQAYDYNMHTSAVNKITLVSNPTDIYSKEPVVFHALTRLVEKAKTAVIHTPYMVLNDKMYEELSRIANSSKVRIMLNSVVNSVNIFTASDYFYNKSKLMNMGVEINELNNFSAYHGKSLLLGDSLCAVGSFNFDIRSAYIDTEIMAVIDSREINAQLRAEMETYEQFASPAKAEKEKGIPFFKRIAITLIHWFGIIRRLF